MVQHQRPLILFDGVCTLCNGAVQFIIKRDKKAHFSFATLQWAADQPAFKSMLNHGTFDSIVLIDQNKIYHGSTAALRIARQLSFPWPLFYGLMLVPRPVRDGVYRWVARNRYRWFGKREVCMVPDRALQSRFLDG